VLIVHFLLGNRLLDVWEIQSRDASAGCVCRGEYRGVPMGHLRPCQDRMCLWALVYWGSSTTRLMSYDAVGVGMKPWVNA
jgi:hypothetical protein